MKKHLTFILALLATVLQILSAQSSCLPQGITFTSQAQIDSFPINYPGCTVIEGDVAIQELVEGEITSLDSLYPITSVEGDLIIGMDEEPYGNKALVSLSGLHNLTTVGGKLWLYANTALTSLSGLGKVNTVGGSFAVFAGFSLTNLSGMESLTSIGGGLAIAANTLMTNLNGLDNLTSISGDLWVSGNEILASLHGLEQLVSIGEDLEIVDNNELTNLSGLEGLASVSGDVYIDYNDGLIDLSGLGNLATVGGSLVVEYNSALTSLEGLENLTSIGISFAVFKNDALEEITGFANVSSLGLNLILADNPLLKSLSGFENVATIKGGLWVENNPVLESLAGLDHHLDELIGYLILENNSKLSFCNIKPVCDFLESGEEGTIANNASGCKNQQQVEAACAVSVDELLPAGAIRIFPNPANGIIRIEAPEDAEWEVSVRDAMGRLLAAPRMLEKGQYDLSGLPAGLYFVELNDGQRSITKRIIRQ